MPVSISSRELCASREAAVFHAPERLWNYLTQSGFHADYAKHYDPAKDKDVMHWIRSVIYLILSEYFRNVPLCSQAPTEKALSRILMYMAEHFREPLTQQSIGNALGYSAKYISNCFHSLGGMSFRTVLNSMRIEEAKRLLTTTDYTNVEIAVECGFSSVSTFHQVFHAQEGCSPKQYSERVNR